MNVKIQEKIQSEISKLGSQEAVANKCGVSITAISQYLSGKYGADINKLESKIVIGLGITDDTWVIARTRDLKLLCNAFEKAKLNGVFLAVSDKAGSGKTTAISFYEKLHQEVYVVRCREWTSRMFLDEVIRILGIDLPKGYVTIDTKLTKICNFFLKRRGNKCQLIIDEADKLRPSALRLLIPIYNECKRLMSVVILGTENLEKEIKRGVAYSRKGYDEIDSRFGRRYLKLQGNTKSDVEAICRANGISDKEITKKIWEACPKKRVTIEKTDVPVVRDMRLLENLIIFN